jgi:hypothetical protein
VHSSARYCCLQSSWPRAPIRDFHLVLDLLYLSIRISVNSHFFCYPLAPLESTGRYASAHTRKSRKDASGPCSSSAARCRAPRATFRPNLRRRTSYKLANWSVGKGTSRCVCTYPIIHVSCNYAHLVLCGRSLTSLADFPCVSRPPHQLSPSGVHLWDLEGHIQLHIASLGRGSDRGTCSGL